MAQTTSRSFAPSCVCRLCVARLVTSDTSLPLCRYHGFRYRPRISPDAVLVELNWFRDLSRTRIGVPVCRGAEVDPVKPPLRVLWHRDHPRSRAYPKGGADGFEKGGASTRLVLPVHSRLGLSRHFIGADKADEMIQPIDIEPSKAVRRRSIHQL